MAETAQAIALEHGLQVEILESEDCEQLGMGAFLGVKASQIYSPTYKPEGKPRRVAIVGKA